MPTNHFSRVLFIALVLLSALWCVFPGGNLLHPALKPGIDMVGGTSLLYEIKPPEGGWNQPTPLSEAVMNALKKRVDPDGVRNLIWRPQGNTRLEIQMPMSSSSSDSKARRETFAEAQRVLESTNIRPAEVLTAVEELKGPARDARLEQLAMGSPARKDLFAKLTAAWDAVSKAHDAKNAEAEADARANYEDLSGKIGDTNLPSKNLEDVLALKPETRATRLKDLQAKYADFPRRLTAVNDFVGKYDAFASVKGSIDDAGELKRLLRGSGVLEFHILADDLTPEEYTRMVKQLREDGPRAQAGDKTKWFEVEKPEEFRGRAVEHDDKHYVLGWTTDDKSLANHEGAPHWALDNAYPETTEGQSAVGFSFNPQGAAMFGELTGKNLHKPLGIVLDDKLISAPNINSQINGSGQITGGNGGFSLPEQRYLISVLNAGSLPAQLTNEPISEVTVGPQLGSENLHAGLRSCYIGLIVVAVFLIGYYYVAGIVAFVAVCINLLLILGVMAFLQATFTLPGVAGIVLSIGAAVDANVLIFERLREEQERGLSLSMALRNAYAKAWSAIVDSNATTVITSIILLLLGSEEVKGFGITLLIGLLSSLFTALFVTKTIFAILLDKGIVRNLSSLPLTFPKWDRMLRPNIDWMKLVLPFIALSTVLLVTGLSAFFYYGHKGQLLDIDFAGGTSVQFELKEKMPREDLVKLLEQHADKLVSPSVVAVGSDGKTYAVDTPDTRTGEVRETILELLGNKLNIEQPSHFTMDDKPFEESFRQVIIPISKFTPDAVKNAAGFVPAALRGYQGGAAIVLKNITPPLTPKEIRDRIDREKNQPQAGEAQLQAARDFSVESPTGEEEKASTAVILVSDPLIPYDKVKDSDVSKWVDGLASPAWALVKESIVKASQFQKVDSFNAQIAGDTESAAITSLVLSLVIILAYIWFRFGNLKYGSATVAAMVHDTFMVVGAIGLAHLLVANISPLASALLLEPFRLNLTLVAAILTVMSYSMIDTIVVFDRIRENRGRYGHLDRQVVNDSINQTLSRTLLTAGTNVLTVFVMYVFGGPGIHGFTFVLLFGILVGTYSSIAVAAPLLLVTRQKPPTTGPARTVGQLQRA